MEKMPYQPDLDRAMTPATTTAGAAVGGQRADLDVGMAQEQAEQLASRVPAGAGYRDPHCHTHDYARSCKTTQLVARLIPAREHG